MSYFKSMTNLKHIKDAKRLLLCMKARRKTLYEQYILTDLQCNALEKVINDLNDQRNGIKIPNNNILINIGAKKEKALDKLFINI